MTSPRFVEQLRARRSEPVATTSARRGGSRYFSNDPAIPPTISGDVLYNIPETISSWYTRRGGEPRVDIGWGERPQGPVAAWTEPQDLSHLGDDSDDDEESIQYATLVIADDGTEVLVDANGYDRQGNNPLEPGYQDGYCNCNGCREIRLADPTDLDGDDYPDEIETDDDYEEEEG
jgi:hypothetical protein